MLWIIGTILWISDLLFPVWWILLLVVFIKKGFSNWKAWGIASSFCVIQAYFVATYIGGNLGGYFIIVVSSLPSLFYRKITHVKIQYSADLDLWFWITPPLILIVFPVIVFYLVSKIRRKTVLEEQPPPT